MAGTADTPDAAAGAEDAEAAADVADAADAAGAAGIPDTLYTPDAAQDTAGAVGHARRGGHGGCAAATARLFRSPWR